MTYNHPFTKFGLAVVLYQTNKTHSEDINPEDVINAIEICLSNFRLCPAELHYGKEKIKYNYIQLENGNPKEGIFLAPNVIATDKSATKTWTAAQNLIDNIKKCGFNKTDKTTMSIAPISGEFLSFSTKGGIVRGKPKNNLLVLGLSMITTLTALKPCLYHQKEYISIIPDLPLKKTIEFIDFFDTMRHHESSTDLMIGKVKHDEKKDSYTFNRPAIYAGNFPNPPKSTALGAISLLATIGEFTKNAHTSKRAKTVLESLKLKPLYLVKYGNAEPFTFHHYVIDLAKEGNLRIIVDSIFYSKLYNQTKREFKNIEYKKFDLFTSRFLQLFNRASFQDFLAFRAEYPNEIELLFTTYFTKMEKINPDIVASAHSLGKWLNAVAYNTAKREIEKGASNYSEKIREQKAKVLVELESSSFSAKTGDALIAQVITRAGRLSGMDAPAEAQLFMETTMSGELELDKARNLLIAFSRLKNSFKTQNEEQATADEENLMHTENTAEDL